MPIIESRTSDRWMTWIVGGLSGAMLMYLFDPRSGRRRRGLFRDQFVSTIRHTRDGLAATWRDAGNRAQGMIAEASTVWKDKPVTVQSGARFELMQENWSPTARMSVGMVGAALAIYGIIRRGRMGAALMLIGAAATTRASLNMPWRRITGVTAGYRAVDVHKTLRVVAPVDRVFSFWSQYAEFPKYTSHVREVVEQGEGRSRWTVVGPAGIAVSWNAVITRFISNRELAWHTEPNSAVQHAGQLKFKENADGTTTLHIRISYNPPLGVIGHGVATTIGADLKTLLEEDLVRIKTVLEQNTIPGDAQRREAESTVMLKAEQLER